MFFQIGYMISLHIGTMLTVSWAADCDPPLAHLMANNPTTNNYTLIDLTHHPLCLLFKFTLLSVTIGVFIYRLTSDSHAVQTEGGIG